MSQVRSNKIVFFFLFLKRLWIISSISRSYSLSYLLPKRSIYIKAINWYINMFMQSGLTFKWHQDSLHYFKLENSLKNKDQYKKNKLKINLEHLEMAFACLFVGYVISTICFIIERIRKRDFCSKHPLLLKYHVQNKHKNLL
jgi:hypothetical protein